MGVLSLYKVFRNNTEQKKKEKGKEGKAGRERKDSGKKKRKSGKREEKTERKKGEKEEERRKGIYCIKRMQEKNDGGSEGLFLQERRN